ncbi:choice-of-anchor D domain-containing protein [Bacteroidetes/Chlorobi group bacterium ChocPot_Mid]|nr:MAG: choice-of-anchor D domain-containing protein [Bacteroidetes/Chlorobi group bacterium ChocPot_Mid]
MKYIKLLYFLISLNLILTLPSQAQRWEKVVSIPQPYLSNYWLDVYFLPSNPSYGWICGFNGRIIRTTDGGNTWLGSTINGANHLESIHFPSVNIGYTSGLDGIFKSTDGGASWFDVTPPSATATMWGCYFLDNNNGFVIGGGCLGNQEFWKTTDGGNSWSVFVGTLPNSGLTDLIVYSMFGQGYASSSGWIWETLDGGNTWTPLSNTGPNDWQEEITKVGNSFLVPTSTGCQGGGGGGGMRFSTDYGATWNRYNTGVRMFGSFLLSAQTGWVAGDSRNVWYTTDGGQNWILRNCGFDDGNLDDIWFITSNNGWIVGEGVYRLAQPLQTADKNSINFGEICIPSDSIDFVLLNNVNFNSDVVNVTILNDPNNEFSIVSPGSSFVINSCETKRLNIKFAPKTVGPKTASVLINYGSGTNLNVNLAGYGVAKTIAPRDTLLKINPAYCGNENVYGIQWTAVTDRESIEDIVRIDGARQIENKTLFPLKIPNGGIQTIFSANPIDTGWISARFKCLVNPCPADTFITVMAYGVSPIITAQTSNTFTLQCKDIGFDTIPIFNTGNNDLIISDAKIVESNTNFSVNGWVNNLKLPVVIPPNTSKSIILNFRKDFSKSNNATLQLINNDQTYANGDKNPYQIKLFGQSLSSNIMTEDTSINFGRVCLGATLTHNFYIMNKGDVEITLEQPLISASQYQISFNATNYPIVLKSGDSVRCIVTFKPDKIGTIEDTIYINSLPCNDIIKVAVTGFGIKIALDTEPQSFSANFQTNTPITKRFNVRSTGTEDIKITRIELGSATQNIQISVNPPLSQLIKFDGNMDFDVTFICSSDTVYDDVLCFIADEGECPAGKCINVFLQSYSTKLEFSKDSVNFGKHLCNEDVYLDTVWIRNPETFSDTIIQLNINQSGTAFSIINKPALPYTIDRNDSIPVIIEYSATAEGLHSATISMISSTAKNLSRYLFVTGEFYKVDTELSERNIDFGDIEICDNLREARIKLKNNGTIADSIIISSVNGFNSFLLVPNTFINIGAKDSSELVIYVNPSDFGVGQHKAKILFTSQICPNVDTLDLSVNIYHHLLTYTPDNINFGEVWAERTETKNFKIENKSAYEKKILFMQIVPDDIHFSIAGNYNYPLNLKSGDSIIVPLRFSAPVQGNYQSFIRIYEESVCIDTAFVNLMATVPEEKYGTVVTVGDYTAKPGQKITIAASLSKPVPYLNQNGMNYKFSFDPYLFFPTAMFAENNSKDRMTIPFSYRNGVVSGVLDSNLTNILLNKSGEVLWIQGLVFLSNPDETPIVIEEFAPITAKQVDIQKIDGKLKLLDVCIPLADFKLKYINKPSIIMNNPVVDGYLSLNIRNTFDKTDFEGNENQYLSTDFSMKITNIEGFTVYENKINVNSEYVEFNIDLSTVPSGLYYLVINTGGYLLTEKFIVIN